ncbi:alpha/beta hydrolase [Pararhodospirillum photometricum]|uniref:Dienelactone hydrolase n=1 Tax=Pararhodospirillum photometricum DSM 122 TaxID=1150469 RepID=H6SQ26_PARPM|nr:alpha/beta hydrolase [Pararhodospirillum photometricum]CCG07296.1 Dienelactone hydrolase [Pararhodospirillum photometricum DSM 122]
MTPPRRAVPLPSWARRAVVAAIGLVLIVLGLTRLLAPLADLSIEKTVVDQTPVTIFRPAAGPSGPAVVIAHGFAGSQQLMDSFAIALARNGYVAVTFDALGHGRDPEPLSGDLALIDGATVYLLNQLHQVAQYALTLVPDQPRLAVLGHSMASDIVVRYANEDPAVAATIAVSMFSPAVTETSPANLLVLVGGLESDLVKGEALRAVAMVAGLAAPQPAVTYGNRDKGTARRYAIAPGVEHIGVLFSRAASAEAVAWLNDVFHRGEARPAPARLPWIGLLLGGVLLLAWPLASLLPKVAPPPSGPALAWRHFLPVALGPAVLTPLILRPLPTDFLPTLVGDYLIVHCAVYGLLTAGGLWWLHHTHGWIPPGWPRLDRAGWIRLGVGGSLVCAYTLLAFGGPVDTFVTAVAPSASRLPLIPIALVGTGLYFLADETLVRGPRRHTGRSILTRVLFLFSLGLAIALDFESLFFLIILVPALAVMLIVFGLFGRWTWQRTGHVAGGAGALAVAFALAIAAIFPVVGD